MVVFNLQIGLSSLTDSISTRAVNSSPTPTAFTNFCSVDKKFLAEIYEQENLMNDLFPNTVSCTNISKIEPCKKCYWCEEKKWAFGMYDGCLK